MSWRIKFPSTDDIIDKFNTLLNICYCIIWMRWLKIYLWVCDWQAIINPNDFSNNNKLSLYLKNLHSHILPIQYCSCETSSNSRSNNKQGILFWSTIKIIYDWFLNQVVTIFIVKWDFRLLLIVLEEIFVLWLLLNWKKLLLICKIWIGLSIVFDWMSLKMFL